VRTGFMSLGRKEWLKEIRVDPILYGGVVHGGAKEARCC